MQSQQKWGLSGRSQPQTASELGEASVLQVTKQEEGWYCEYDSKVYPAMVRRYVMLAKCTDATAELSISIFNEQVRPTYLHHMQGIPSAFSQVLSALLPSRLTEGSG